MDSLNLSPIDYAKTVIQIGDQSDLSLVDYSVVLPRTIVLAIAMPASTSTGKPFPSQSPLLPSSLYLAHRIIQFGEVKHEILRHLEGKLSVLAPNVISIIGTRIASQLVATAGGITALSRIPSGNIQNLGRQVKKELAGFSLSHVNPHAGFIYECDLVQSTPLQYRTQAQRLIANKVALAARIDALKEHPTGSYGASLRKDIIQKLEKLIEPAPISKIKPIPPPPIEPSKKRGGRRARRQKEKFGMTQVRKLANRMEFGKVEDEVIVGSSVAGLGELSSASKVQVSHHLRNHLKQQSQKAHSKRTNSNNITLPHMKPSFGKEQASTGSTVGGSSNFMVDQGQDSTPPSFRK